MHGPVERQRRRRPAGALVGAGQPVPQLLALRLLAATAHQRRREQRFGVAEHLQPHPRHAAEETGLDAQQRIVAQRVGVADQLLPVLDQVGPAGVQEAHLGVGLDRRQPRQRPVQLRHMAPVEPVRGVGEQQVPAALQHGLDPPAEPVPGVEGATVTGALLAEAVAVLVHVEQRGGGVDAQGVQPEPAVGHPGVQPDRFPELLLGLRIRAHRVGVDPSQPGEVGRGPRALRAEVHHVPHKLPPGVPPGPGGRLTLQPTTLPRTVVARRNGEPSEVAPRGIVPVGGGGRRGRGRAAEVRRRGSRGARGDGG